MPFRSGQGLSGSGGGVNFAGPSGGAYNGVTGSFGLNPTQQSRKVRRTSTGGGMTPSQVLSAFGVAAPTTTLAGPWAANPETYTGTGGNMAPAYVSPSERAAAFSPAGADFGFGNNTPGGMTPGYAAAQAASGNPAGGGNQTVDTSNIGGSTNGSDLAKFTFQPGGKQYSQQDIAMLLNNPGLFQKELLSSLGIDTPTAMGAMGNYYQALPDLATFFTAQRGGRLDDGDKMAGLYDQMLTNYVTPGGRTIMPSEILHSLLGIGQVGSGQLPSNELQLHYAGGTPQDQMAAVAGLWNAMTGGLPGQYGDDMSNLMAQAQLAYQQSLLNANNGQAGSTGIPNQTFTQFLAASPLFRRLAGM